MNVHPVSPVTLLAFASHELNEAESARVAEHMQLCAECTATVTKFRAIQSLVVNDDTVAPPAATIARAVRLYSRHNAIAHGLWLKFFRSIRYLSTNPALVAISVALLLFATVRTVLPATADALPGDKLYPVKATLEDMQLLLTWGDDAKVELQLVYARRRVQEIQALVKQGRYDDVPQATADYEQHVQNASETLNEVVKQDPEKQIILAQKAESNIAIYTNALSALQQASTAEAQSAIERAIKTSDSVRDTVQNQLVDITSPTPAPAPILEPTSALPPPTATDTPLPVPTAVLRPVPTNTPAPIVTVVPLQPLPADTPVPLPNSPAPTSTPVPLPTATSTPVPPPTATSTPVLPPTATDEPEPPPTATSTPVLPPTATSTPVPAATNTPAPAPTATAALSTPDAPSPTPASNNPVDSPSAATAPALTATPKPENTPLPSASPSSTPVSVRELIQESFEL